MGRESEQGDDGGSSGYCACAASALACHHDTADDNDGGEKSRYRVQQSRAKSVEQDGHHIEGGIDRPEGVERQSPAAQQQVPVAHRLTFEDDACTVGIARIGVDAGGIEEKHQADEDNHPGHHHQGTAAAPRRLPSLVPEVVEVEPYRRRHGRGS